MPPKCNVTARIFIEHYKLVLKFMCKNFNKDKIDREQKNELVLLDIKTLWVCSVAVGQHERNRSE